MQERHINRNKYFEEQSITTEKYVIPFINSVKKIDRQTSVLEIGCGEGGNLVPFAKLGCKRVLGIDMSQAKIANANTFFRNMNLSERTEFVCDDIYNISPEDIGTFDVIIMRDVLEHIHNQEKFMDFVRRFMKPDSAFFLGFPPWHNPFGGHQQICRSKFLSKLPYFHILPKALYRFILKSFGEPERGIESLLEIKDTRISIERFEKIIKKTYKKQKRIFYLINPNYEIKFGLKPRKISSLISWIPFFRGFFITTNYYVISLK